MRTKKFSYKSLRRSFSIFSRLDNNSIEAFNGRAFKRLHRLNKVLLNKNTCINEDFFGKTEIELIQEVITEKCGFEETLSEDELSDNLFNVQCGNVSYSTGFVIGGVEVDRGQWPFLVALYHIEQQQFFCGGSLITTQHVLTGNVKSFRYHREY